MTVAPPPPPPDTSQYEGDEVLRGPAWLWAIVWSLLAAALIFMLVAAVVA